MTRYLFNQTDFTHGELAPTLYARSDLDLYRKAAKQLRNILIIPQGGAVRRFGLEYVDEFEAIEDQYIIQQFSFSDTKSYLLVFVDKAILVYENDIKVAAIISPWPGSILPELKMTAANNLLIIVHEDYPPYQLRIKTLQPLVWEILPVVIKFYPTNDFKKNYEDVVFKLAAGQEKIGDDRILTADVDIFESTHLGGMFVGIGFTGNDLGFPHIGVGRITEVTNAKAVKMTITEAFDANLFNSVAGVKGKNCYLGEVSWSTGYGWPKTATFYEGRLWLGGSKSLPQSLFGSVIYDFFNFDQGQGEADDAIIITINSNEIENIKNIIGDRNLQIFCLNSEFVTGTNVDQKISLDTISVKKQTGNGSSNITPVVLDNQTIYVRRGGRIISNFIYDNTQQAYQALNISVLSSHLIRNPVDMDIRKGATVDDIDFLMLINSDGTLALYQTLAEQKIAAWTLCETVNSTNGKFKRVATVGENVYFVVQREIYGIRRNYIEKLNFDTYVDSAKIQDLPVPSSIISNLQHLEGENVQIVGDGYIFTPAKVEDGQVLIDKEVSHVEVGLPYNPLIETLPIAIPISAGSVSYTPKTKIKAYIDFYESVGIYVNDFMIPFWEFQSFPYLPPDPISNFAQIPLISGWQARQTLTITQKDPLPMMIIGIGYELEI